MLIEFATFRLVDGASEESFLAADEGVQQGVVPHAPGFVRRTTARGEDGEWAVITLWGSRKDADRCAESAADSPEWRRFEELVDASSLELRRYRDLDD